ncbi:hypothetical protein RDI58_001422 [Solanum bulbocastanum]|uniref:Uncharacterized protein n=1 Tax=Solanum bulbocastanum TaxID=147425 RepID=A0AAN8YN67_SOLBU
MDNISVFNFFF